MSGARNRGGVGKDSCRALSAVSVQMYLYPTTIHALHYTTIHYTTIHYIQTCSREFVRSQASVEGFSALYFVCFYKLYTRAPLTAVAQFVPVFVSGVKWYAPRIKHIVVDVWCGTETAPAVHDHPPVAESLFVCPPTSSASVKQVPVVTEVTAAEFWGNITKYEPAKSYRISAHYHGIVFYCRSKQPVLIRGSDIGPCSHLWTPQYLKVCADACKYGYLKYCRHILSLYRPKK
jgi:hypothetical protein